MKLLTFIALTLAILSGCTRESNRLMNQDELDAIRTDLDTQACTARIDSLGFEIDGILYYAGLDGDERPIVELLPDSLPVCPSSKLEYSIEETENEIIIICPSGHGSLTVQKTR